MFREQICDIFGKEWWDIRWVKAEFIKIFYYVGITATGFLEAEDKYVVSPRIPVMCIFNNFCYHVSLNDEWFLDIHNHSL